MKITGKVILLPFEGGAYGIEDDHGKQYLPINMPNQLKKDGARVKCSVRKTDDVSIIMWGDPVFIDSFETLS
jgi:hypothetical protein